MTGQTSTTGETIGALSCSTSKSTRVSVSDSGNPPVTTTTLMNSNIITSHPDPLTSHTSVTSSFQLQGIPSFSMISQTDSSISTSTSATLSAGNMIRKDLGISGCIPSSTTPAQVTTTMQSSPTHGSKHALVHQPSNIQSGEETASFSHWSKPDLKKKQTPMSSTTTTSTPFTTTLTGTVQQRIVINTTTPLAAGTQILLNNTRFVVPRQGLGPGTHVLVISSPASQQVPTASAASTVALVPPPQGTSSATVAPQVPVLSQSSTRLACVPAAGSSFVACTTAVGSAMLSNTPNVMSVRVTGTPGLGSALPSKTNVVSALPRLPTVQTEHCASGTLKLVSSPPRLSIPALLSPGITSAPAPGSVAATVRFAAGMPMQTNYSSPILSSVAQPLSRLSASQSSLPVLPSPSAVSLPSPASLSSAATPQAAGTSLHSSLPAIQVSVSTSSPGTYSQQAARIVAPSTSLSQALLHTGLGNTSIKTQAPAVMQPVLAAARTQMLPRVAVPPIISTVSKVQTLPIATVPPIGSTVSPPETSPVVTTSPSSGTVIITPSQSLTSLTVNNTIHPPDILTNQVVGKHSLQTSALDIHANVSSKLLLSPDRAVLSTVQCQVHPAELPAYPKLLDVLMVPPNSSTGTLHTLDSSFQPSQADTN